MVKPSDKPVQPFLKWAGGKRQLLPEIRNHLPDPGKYASYYEPFLGGGAVLFEVQPRQRAIVNDINEEIINAYEVIRDDIEGLIKDLRKHRNDPDYFYQVRETDRAPGYGDLTKIAKASRIIYLNKTCYNGLFRVNSQGQFNVPFGKYKNPNIVNEPVLRAAHRYLRGADITFLNCDFEEAVKGIRKGAFVYFDPPYHPLSGSSSFTGYSLGGFDEKDQVRLKELCDDLHEKGCKILLSNSHCEFILDLYREKRYRKVRIAAARNINSVGSGRGKISEVLIKNYA